MAVDRFHSHSPSTSNSGILLGINGTSWQRDIETDVICKQIHSDFGHNAPPWKPAGLNDNPGTLDEVFFSESACKKSL